MRSQAMLVACLAILLAPTVALAKPPMLFVSAEAGGEVVVIDPAKAQVVERIKVGPRPRDLDLSKDGKRVFVAVAGPQKAAPKPGPPAAPPAAGAGLTIIDVPGRKVEKQIATLPGAFGVGVSPDGKT